MTVPGTPASDGPLLAGNERNRLECEKLKLEVEELRWSWRRKLLLPFLVGFIPAAAAAYGWYLEHTLSSIKSERGLLAAEKDKLRLESETADLERKVAALRKEQDQLDRQKLAILSLLGGSGQDVKSIRERLSAIRTRSAMELPALLAPLDSDLLRLENKFSLPLLSEEIETNLDKLRLLVLELLKLVQKQPISGEDTQHAHDLVEEGEKILKLTTASVLNFRALATTDADKLKVEKMDDSLKSNAATLMNLRYVVEH